MERSNNTCVEDSSERASKPLNMYKEIYKIAMHFTQKVWTDF